MISANIENLPTQTKLEDKKVLTPKKSPPNYEESFTLASKNNNWKVQLLDKEGHGKDGEGAESKRSIDRSMTPHSIGQSSAGTANANPSTPKAPINISVGKSQLQ